MLSQLPSLPCPSTNHPTPLLPLPTATLPYYQPTLPTTLPTTPPHSATTPLHCHPSLLPPHSATTPLPHPSPRVRHPAPLPLPHARHPPHPPRRHRRLGHRLFYQHLPRRHQAMAETGGAVDHGAKVLGAAWGGEGVGVSARMGYSTRRDMKWGQGGCQSNRRCKRTICLKS